MEKRNFKAIGRYLYKKRKARGYVQGEVAKALGFLSPQFISNIERGLAMPPMNCLRKLIFMYKINRDEIINLLLEEESKYLKAVIYGKIELPKRKVRKNWKKRRKS